MSRNWRPVSTRSPVSETFESTELAVRRHLSITSLLKLRSSARGSEYNSVKVSKRGQLSLPLSSSEAATTAIEDESSPPLRSAATVPFELRIRQRTASRKISKKCSAYSSSV